MSLTQERMQRLKTRLQCTRAYRALTVLLVALFTLACQPLTPTPAATPVDAIATVMPVEATATPVEAAPLPQPVAAALPPVGIAMPALDLEFPVTPMGWETVEVDGVRTTRWIVPEDAVGWARNSTGAGGAGNMILAGHQMRGDAVFAVLALGEVETGQEILLTDESGAQFTYRVVEVSAPLPVLGATAEERAQAADYIAPTTSPRLTLITGWPTATTTHRIFVVAELTASAE